MSRFNNHGRGAWGVHRPDTFPTGATRHNQNVGRRDNIVLQRPPMDDGDLEDTPHVNPDGSSRRQQGGGRRDYGSYSRFPSEEAELEFNHTEVHPPHDPVNDKLDRLLDRFDKWEAWKEEADRKLRTLDRPHARDVEASSDSEGDDAWESRVRRRLQSRDPGAQPRNPNAGWREGLREGQPWPQGRRADREAAASYWDDQGQGQPRVGDGDRRNSCNPRWCSGENLGPNPNRRLDHRARNDDDDSDGDGARRRRNWEQGSRSRNPNDGPRDRRVDDRDRGENRGRPTSCWDPPWMCHTTAYQHSSSYELDMNSPPPPRRRPTCWDPPAFRETPRQRPFHEVSTYVQPLLPDSNFHWNKPYTACDKAASPHTFPRSYSAGQTASQQPRSAAPPLAAAAPSPPLRSDRPQKQPDTASTIEQPPYAAPRACQPLQSLPVSAPFLASTHHPLAGVSSSRKEEWETHLHDGEEKREDKLTELNSVWNQQEKVSDSTAKREEEVNKNFPKLIEKETKAEVLRASLETKEKDLSVRPEQKTTIEKMEIQCLVEEHKPAFGIQKNIVEDKWKENEMGPKGLVGSKDEEDNDIFRMIKVIILRAFDPGIHVSFSKRKYGFFAMPLGNSDLHESENEMPLEGVIKCLFAAAETFRIELHMPATHVVFKTVQECNGDLNVTDIMRLPSLDADGRLIPPRNNKPCMIIQGSVVELSMLVLNLDYHISLPSLNFYGGDKGRRSAVRCVFDPGGDA